MSETKYGRFPDDLYPPKWLPNWKNPQEYVVPDDIHDGDSALRYFAWQFLRRNYVYQQNYYETLEYAELVDETLGNTNGRGYCRNYGIYAYSEEESDNRFEELLKQTAYYFMLNSFLPDPYNPLFAIPQLSIGNNIRRPPITFDDDLLDYDRLIYIDMRYPLKPQLDRAHELLKVEQIEKIGKGKGKPLAPSQNKRHKDKLIRYLRVLDADTTGATPLEIIQHLPIDKKRYDVANVKNNGKGAHSPAHNELYKLRKEARNLRDIDWRSLLD